MKYTPNNMPGPGDEATWTPYSGHGLDPRQPAEDDSIVREEARNDLILEKIQKDVVWFTEAIEEASEASLQILVGAYMAEDWESVKAVMDSILDYASPTEEEITDHIRRQK